MRSVSPILALARSCIWCDFSPRALLPSSLCCSSLSFLRRASVLSSISSSSTLREFSARPRNRDGGVGYPSSSSLSRNSKTLSSMALFLSCSKISGSGLRCLCRWKSSTLYGVPGPRSRGLRCERFLCTYPDVPLPRGVERPTFDDMMPGVLPGALWLQDVL